MPIRDCAIHSLQNSNTTVVLPVKVINPFNNLSLKIFGLIDTGATECAMPAAIANILGHNLKNGRPKQINTGNGISYAYSHTSIIEIFHPENSNGTPIYVMNNVLIDFMPNLSVPLLGVVGFLSKFILQINYPKRIFSLIKVD